MSDLPMVQQPAWFHQAHAEIRSLRESLAVVQKLSSTEEERRTAIVGIHTRMDWLENTCAAYIQAEMSIIQYKNIYPDSQIVDESL
jgi:hypothetical protein